MNDYIEKQRLQSMEALKDGLSRSTTAAPDLLEACKHLVAILDQESEDFYNKHIHAFNLGMDAIEKAEGKK